jgi:hypothetical protein
MPIVELQVLMGCRPIFGETMVKLTTETDAMSKYRASDSGFASRGNQNDRRLCSISIRNRNGCASYTEDRRRGA